MHSMKLFAAPLVFGIAGQSLKAQRGLPLGHLVFIDTCPLPMSADDRITKRAAVRRANTFSIVKILVAIIVTTKTGEQRSIQCAELCAAMLCVAGNAVD